MQFSVLDQSMVVSGRSPAESIRETLELGPVLEALGYRRLWLSEHHNSAAVAGSAPEVLLGALAARTTSIRLGSAGIMLPHYSALHVAEQFRVLEALAPGRIDLGVGRAPGSDPLTAHALNPRASEAVALFPAQVRDLCAWSSGGKLPDNHPFRSVEAQPGGTGAPAIWMLGSSLFGAQAAAYFGLPYAYAYFFNEGEGAQEALRLYRTTFQPGVIAAPYAAIAVFAVAAESDAEAERLFLSREVWRAAREHGRYIPLPSPEEAADYVFSAEERVRNAALREKAPVGRPDKVRSRLHRIADDVSADEIAVVTAVHDPLARKRSYTLLQQG